MTQKIIYSDNDGVHVVTPAPKATETLEEIAAKAVPENATYRVIDAGDLPQSKNWRGAWTDTGSEVDIDLTKAKECHKALIHQKAMARVLKDGFGRQDFTAVEAEIAAIDFDAIADLQSLYNAWPQEIEQRSSARVYQMHEQESA